MFRPNRFVGLSENVEESQEQLSSSLQDKQRSFDQDLIQRTRRTFRKQFEAICFGG